MKNGQPLELCEDVLFQIFLRLPARDLFPFKSISTYWNDLIMSRLFVNSHLRRWNGRAGVTFMMGTYLEFELFHLYLDGDKHAINKLYQKYPPEWSLKGDYIIDSCDGLVLVQARLLKTNEKHLLLSNPVTGSYVFLPNPPFYSEWSPEKTGHILYDASLKRYKVLYRYKYEEYYIIDVDNNSGLTSESEWRKISSSQWRPWVSRESEPEYREYNAGDVLFEGKFHSVIGFEGDPDENLRLLTLDVATEKFHRVDCPPRPFARRSGWPLSFSGSNGKFYYMEFTPSLDGIQLMGLADLNHLRPTWFKRLLPLNVPPIWVLLLEYSSEDAHVFEHDSKIVFMNKIYNSFMIYEMDSGKCSCISLADYTEGAKTIPWINSMIYVSSLVSCRHGC
ncbi:hypothetical protein SAY87_006841 [Trapa incisa]|uniref:F-box domain-containing protein n=1 Tax=Trapa incisa TaxID=236973 RepID=A0AAN7K012_9MYRT|nr:hypothetical protein SAY87_006841 [Trapa incisa]